MTQRLPTRPCALLACGGIASTLLLASCGDTSVFRPDPDADPPALHLPVEGQVNEDFYLVSYMDVSAIPAATLDYTCGTKTFEGHSGVDLTLRSFSHMDEGVHVAAAARGVVSHVRDGLFDRNRDRDPARGLGNHVIVDHHGGLQTVYAHMRNGSVLVQEGAEVDVATRLGQVGSSGRSDHPHLHFEVRRDGTPVEPFKGLCGPETTLWATPLPYQDEFQLIDAGVTRSELDLDAVTDPPERTETFTTGDDRMWAWVQLANVPAGSLGRFELVSPEEEIVLNATILHGTLHGMSWWWFSVDVEGVAGEPGQWTVRYRNGGVLVSEVSYRVQAGAEGLGAARAGPRATPAVGTGGGGLPH